MSDAPAGIDPRGPRFTAAVTFVVLAVALLLSDARPGLAAVVTGSASSGSGSNSRYRHSDGARAATAAGVTAALILSR